MATRNNFLQMLPSNEILNLAEFVVSENFKHHTENELPSNYRSDINSIYKEELRFFNDSQIYVSKNSHGAIEGAIRVLKWNYADVLPIEKIFGINPLHVVGMSPLKSIWHIGRFAIKKEASDLNLFKKLMVCAIAPICERENSVAFAECDSKLLRVLKALGIGATVVGESINYLGSETIPVCMTYEGLIGFYNKNKHLVSDELRLDTQKSLNLPESVVFNTQDFNYTLV